MNPLLESVIASVTATGMAYFIVWFCFEYTAQNNDSLKVDTKEVNQDG